MPLRWALLGLLVSLTACNSNDASTAAGATPTATASLSPGDTASPTPGSTLSPTPSASPGSSPTTSPSASPGGTPDVTASASPTPAASPQPGTPSPQPGASASPSPSPSAGPTSTPTPGPGFKSTEADFHSLRIEPLATGEFALLTLSTLPDAVSGGDVRLGLRGFSQDSETLPQIDLNGQPRNDLAWQFDADTATWHALLDGLAPQQNLVVARLDGQIAQLQLRNHPITGPILSGPHQTPFECEPQDNGYAPEDVQDANCSLPTRYRWYARDAQNQSWILLSDPYAGYPDGTPSTVTRDGDVVPFVVRVESKTINRGVTRIAVLDDPAARAPDAPFQPHFNQRIYYIFGESCGVGYKQGDNDDFYVLGQLPSGVDSQRLLINFVGGSERLAKGDAVVHSTLSAFGVHCNPFISIETTMMVKEHIVEQYGLVSQMIGTNGSGAALQQYNAANNAPGLLSGMMPTATFVDIASTAMTVTDCGLLEHFFAGRSGWEDPRVQASVTGHNLLTSINNDSYQQLDPSAGSEVFNNAICLSWVDTFFDRVIPDQGCADSATRYHPESNPDGVRCTIQDANVNWLGVDPETGFARRPLDNVGVQYGLQALRDGEITADMFIELNRDIGGLDIDGRFVPERHAMSEDLAALLYRIGQVVGRGALAETPVMDIAPYLDLIPQANIHEAVRPFTARARLAEQVGYTDSQTIWRGVLTQPDAFDEMDAWTDALRALRLAGASGGPAQEVLAARPSGLSDVCAFATTGGRLDFPSAIYGPLGTQAPLLPIAPAAGLPLRVNLTESWDERGQGLGPCANILPVTGTPRIAADMPISDDVLKCQLKPVVSEDYADVSGWSEAHTQQLREVFPQGVCDYSQPAAADVERSLLWPSLGGAELLTDADGRLAPQELKWRVALSQPE